jgi:YfiH family protein
MLRTRVLPDGSELLKSPKLEAIGVPHGFTTSIGAGGGRWSVKTADDLAAALEAEGLSGRTVVMGRQVHGAAVTVPASRELYGNDDADAHASDDDNELVAVRTADCVPILLSLRNGHVVAAVHAGWRGLEAGVIREAVRIITNRDDGSVDAGHGVAAVGPCICVDHYEVGEDVAHRFEHGVTRQDAWPRPHLDLRAIALRQLLQAGLPVEQIDVATPCTYTDAGRFGSYRRNGKGCGHQAAYIGPVGTS